MIDKNKKGLPALIVSMYSGKGKKPEDDKEQAEEKEEAGLDDSEQDWLDLAQEMLDAIEKQDKDALASALKAICELSH